MAALKYVVGRAVGDHAELKRTSVRGPKPISVSFFFQFLIEINFLLFYTYGYSDQVGRTRIAIKTKYIIVKYLQNVYWLTHGDPKHVRVRRGRMRSYAL